MNMHAVLVCSLAMTLSTFSGSVFAQESTPEGAEVTFRNGVHLRIETEQTAKGGPSFLSSQLAVKNPDIVHRLFTDARNRLGFGYDFDAIPAAGHPGEIEIQLKPLDASVLPVLQEQQIDAQLDAKKQLPTFERERNFGPVRVGDTVSIDVFTDPVSGNKVTDVIEVLSAKRTIRPHEMTRGFQTTNLGAMFEFADVRVWLNGKEVTSQQPLRTISGKYPVLYIPGHGSFFIALEPFKDLPFVQAGTVTRSKLQFTIGADSIECTSSLPILANEGWTPIWVWHVVKYKPSIPEIDAFVGPPAHDELQVAVADSMEIWRSSVLTHGRLF